MHFSLYSGTHRKDIMSPTLRSWEPKSDPSAQRKMPDKECEGKPDLFDKYWNKYWNINLWFLKTGFAITLVLWVVIDHLSGYRGLLREAASEACSKKYAAGEVTYWRHGKELYQGPVEVVDEMIRCNINNTILNETMTEDTHGVYDLTSEVNATSRIIYCDSYNICGPFCNFVKTMLRSCDELPGNPKCPDNKGHILFDFLTFDLFKPQPRPQPKVRVEVIAVMDLNAECMEKCEEARSFTSTVGRWVLNFIWVFISAFRLLNLGFSAVFILFIALILAVIFCKAIYSVYSCIRRRRLF